MPRSAAPVRTRPIRRSTTVFYSVISRPRRSGREDAHAPLPPRRPAWGVERTVDIVESTASGAEVATAPRGGFARVDAQVRLPFPTAGAPSGRHLFAPDASVPRVSPRQEHGRGGAVRITLARASGWSSRAVPTAPGEVAIGARVMGASLFTAGLRGDTPPRGVGASMSTAPTSTNAHAHHSRAGGGRRGALLRPATAGGSRRRWRGRGEGRPTSR